jgi:hypothetical protein
VERQQRGTTTTNNNKDKDAMKEKTKKTLDSSDLLIETRLLGNWLRLLAGFLWYARIDLAQVVVPPANNASSLFP